MPSAPTGKRRIRRIGEVLPDRLVIPPESMRLFEAVNGCDLLRMCGRARQPDGDGRIGWKSLTSAAQISILANRILAKQSTI
jgi:hypothetical protein